ncbi:hypothetical protein LIER_19548 [Lithospermum erythrorhizon]|uniref:ATP-dependent DNA helicase n=1 Tax=Lithospermum erythrorhizon TaxID=34254 RepID=A0AAV3QL56_LITER
MTDKSIIHVIDNLLQDLCENEKPFGGMLVVFWGDFRQVLPVVRGEGRTQQVEASIVSSELWENFIMLKLIDNMRARQDLGFVEFLMRIGNGTKPPNERDEIEIPQPMLIPYTTMEQSIEELIPNVRQFPLRMSFAMTINKTQHQTFDCVGTYLKQHVFSHGQLYVALLGAKTGEKVRIFIIPAICSDPRTKYTTNVVYNEVLAKASVT